MKNNPFSFFLDQLEQKLPDSLRPMPTEIRTAARAMIDERLNLTGCRAVNLKHRNACWHKQKRALPHWKRS